MKTIKIAALTAAILCATAASAGPFTIGGGNAASSSSSVSGGAAGAITLGTGLHGATTANSSSGNAQSGVVVSPGQVVTQSTTSSIFNNTSLSGGIGFGGAAAGGLSGSTTGANAAGGMGTFMWVFP